MLDTVVGRDAEIRALQHAFKSKEAELIAVVGRRRVGKTFLIREVFASRIAFEVTGLQHATTATQIQHFHFNLIQQFDRPELPLADNWLRTFFDLQRILDEGESDKRRVLFFDELPWLAGRRREFLTAFGAFWNGWAVKRNVVVVICGSAASWMIEKVVNDTGGLYNRITKRIYLKPFTLAETQLFLQRKGVDYPPKMLAELYMILGGIPHYLKEIDSGKSLVQNIDALCFAPTGALRNEFDQLYPALFRDAERHIRVIRALANRRQGMTRSEVVKKSGLPEGGNTTQVLTELEQSSFIQSYYQFGKKRKGKVYRLVDEYSLFYLRFIETNKEEGAGTWMQLSQTQAYKIWSGYAFENLGLKHLPEIKRALGIDGIYSQSSSFYRRGTDTQGGVQIDFLIDRNDQVIDLVEAKFHDEPFSITKAYAAQLREKRRRFREATGTRKLLRIVMLTPYGVVPGGYAEELVPQSIVLEDLY